MHQFIATLFSLLIALCHHTSLSARPVEAAEIHTDSSVTDSESSSSMILPDRYQLARYGTAEASYAGSACISCRRMDTFSSDR